MVMDRNVYTVYYYYFRGYKLVLDPYLPNIAIVSRLHSIPLVIYRMFFDPHTGEVS